MVGPYQARTDAQINVTGASYCYLLFIDAMKVAVCPRVVTKRFIDITCNDCISGFPGYYHSTNAQYPFTLLSPMSYDISN